jgi:hypothetical protein
VRNCFHLPIHTEGTTTWIVNLVTDGNAYAVVFPEIGRRSDTYGAALMIRLQTVEGCTMLNGALARRQPGTIGPLGLVLVSVRRFPSDAGRLSDRPGTSRGLLQFVPEFFALFVDGRDDQSHCHAEADQGCF